jgi:methylphosphotriester-DNA--protein-cysteine methyltransferase
LDRRLDAIAGLLEETMRARGEGANGNGSHAQNGFVVAGKSSFHRPTCRLVIGKEDQVLMTSEEALERGLTPCRLCAPVVLVDEPQSITEH